MRARIHLDIDEQTRVRLYTVLIALPIVATWLWYMASIFHDVAQAKLKDAQQDVLIERSYNMILDNKEKQMIYLIEIDKRTIRIEESLRKIGR